VNQHEICSGKNVGEPIKKPHSSEDKPNVSIAQADDVTGSADISGEHLLKDGQSSRKREPQRASKSAACSTESNVYQSDVTQQTRTSSADTPDSMEKPCSITLPDDTFVSFPSRKVINQNIIKIIQVFWEDFKARGLFLDTKEAVLILRL